MLELLLVFLAALGLLTFLWCLAGLVLRPERETLSIRCCQGNGDRLEQTVRAYGWLRGTGLVRGQLLLMDCGLTAQQLQETRDWVIYCPRESLEDCLTLLEDTI